MNTLYLDLRNETDNDRFHELQGNCFNHGIKWSEFWKYPTNTYINIDNIDLKDKYIKITDSGITLESYVDIKEEFRTIKDCIDCIQEFCGIENYKILYPYSNCNLETYKGWYGYFTNTPSWNLESDYYGKLIDIAFSEDKLFKAEDFRDLFMFFLPVYKPTLKKIDKLMTHNQLAECLLKGKCYKKDEKRVSTYHDYMIGDDNKEINEVIKIRLIGTNEWIKPTLSIYNELCGDK